MLIREQGHSVKLIRAERNPDSPRTRQKLIGTFRRDDGPSRALLAQLSGDEQAALKRWLSVRHDRQEHAQHRHTIDAAHSRLAELVVAINSAAELLTPAQADAIWNELVAVTRALNRAGYPKPKRERKPPATPPGQRDLLTPDA
ncbi:hypothetical protein AAGS40_30165 (plasmid) [Paraburkholderia sp. PREW-6R]|uniref:hypothetical protein n=1 Tax=Paraburkholderia sp. PREW-6R TaxID=3141544 RepID=UPI0031F5A1DF